MVDGWSGQGGWGMPQKDFDIKTEIKTEPTVKTEITEPTVKTEIKTESTIKSVIKTEPTVKTEIKTEPTIKTKIKTEPTIKTEIFRFQCHTIQDHQGPDR